MQKSIYQDIFQTIIFQINLICNDILIEKRWIILLRESVKQKVEIKDFNKSQTNNGYQKIHLVRQKDLDVDLKLHFNISVEEEEDNKEQIGLKNDMNENAFLLLDYIQSAKTEKIIIKQQYQCIEIELVLMYQGQKISAILVICKSKKQLSHTKLVSHKTICSITRGS